MVAGKESSVARGELSRWSRFLFRRPKKTSAATMLLMLVMVDACATIAEAGYKETVVHLHFNLAEGKPEELYDELRKVLVDNIPRLEVSGHVYLGPKPPVADKSPPGRWIHLHLHGEKDEEVATLALTDGEIYLLAFANNAGTWHAFKGYEIFFKDAIVLEGLSESYTRLHGSYAELYTVPLGKAAALQALRTLAHYDDEVQFAKDLKPALVTFMIMVSEAMRFKPIREAFSGEQWEMESHLDKVQAKYVVRWGQMSYMLFHWETTGDWEGSAKEDIKKDINVDGPEKALEILDLLKRPYSMCIPVPNKKDEE